MCEGVWASGFTAVLGEIVRQTERHSIIQMVYQVDAMWRKCFCWPALTPCVCKTVHALKKIHIATRNRQLCIFCKVFYLSLRFLLIF